MKNQYYIEFVQNAFLPHYQIGSNPAAGARALVCHSDGDLFLYLRWKVHTVHAGKGGGLLHLPQPDTGGGGRIHTLRRFRDMGPKEASRVSSEQKAVWQDHCIVDWEVLWSKKFHWYRWTRCWCLRLQDTANPALQTGPADQLVHRPVWSRQSVGSPDYQTLWTGTRASPTLTRFTWSRVTAASGRGTFWTTIYAIWMGLFISCKSCTSNIIVRFLINFL